MEKWMSWIVVVIGILLLLPLIGLEIGVVSEWLITIGVLVIGLVWAFSKK